MLHDYLTAICGIKESDKEHTHRSALENLFKAILENLTQSHKDFSKIAIIHEPNNDKSENKAGAPDFLIQQNGLSLGYIENKRVNADLARLIDESNQNPKAQIAKYLTLSDNLILTDYLRFLRIAKDDKGKIIITQEITICALNEIQAILKNKSALVSKQSEILDFFALFFSSTPKPIISALEFASTLAQRTRLIKDNLIENPQNPQISTLYQNFRDILYKDLDFESFCDSFAQTLTYALFLARLNNSTEPNATQGEFIDLYNAKKFIPKSFPLIRAMSGFLDNLDELDSLKWLIKEILSIINHIDPAQITIELNKIADKDLIGDYLHKDPYLHFYETFLSQYDPHLRELRGVYYTPFAVVSFIINAIDTTLKSDFGEAKGLGSALNNDNITLLDFATGTGTFLLQAFRKALESAKKDNLNYAPKNLLNRFSGFEYLIAPYTIAHLKISQSFKEEFNAPLGIVKVIDEKTGKVVDKYEKLNILLTNTIYAKSAKDEQNEKSNLVAGMYELNQESSDAQNLKKQQILIITGNPPYSGASANKGLYEDEVKIAYGLEPNSANLNSEAQRIIKSYFANPSDKAKQKDFRGIYESRKLQNEKNPKWLLDDYVKFIRFAESKIESQDSGIIAIISNNSFLDNPTFRGMRYHLLNTFDKIYILDLHGNARKKEVAPDGNKDDNVFDIMQGVCISVFVKTGAKNNPSLRGKSKSPDSSLRDSRSESKQSTPAPSLRGSVSEANTTKQSTIICHTERAKRPKNLKEAQNRDISLISRQAQYDKDLDCHESANADSRNDGVESNANSRNDESHSPSLRGSVSEANTTKQSTIICHTERSEVSQKSNDRDSSLSTKAQNDNRKKAEYDDKLARLYHYDLYGKRKDKYAFLQGNGLESIAWSELAPKAPFYLFIPQNESLRAEYEKGISVKDIFKVSSVGIVSGRDDFCISKTDSQESLQELKNNITKFMNLDCESARKEFDLKDSRDWKVEYAQKELQSTNNNPNNYIKIQYRPFDSRWTYYTGKSKGFHCMPRGEVMKHFLPSDSSLRDLPKANRGNPQNENVGLNVARQSKIQGSWQYVSITNSLVDFSLMGGGNTGNGYIFPLYLIESDSKIENFTPEFRAFIDAKYGESYAPEVILGYIYAVLYHKDYREKYVDFLKIDFPKVPFVKSKKDFLALSALGCELVDLHLLRDNELDSSVGENTLLNERNEKIEKIAYNAESKRLFVNASLYFENVSAEVWEYKIGGYAVLDKYLKSHKGENIDYAHFERVIKTLHKSLQIQSKIAQIPLR
ncbi:type ISP restriction/modification enzyme [Helicobacter sp. T3_23-1056]